MYPHVIHLRGPWQCLLPDGANPINLKMPCRWDTISARPGEQVSFTRKFGCPRTLDPEEKIWLTFTGFASSLEASLNDVYMGGSDKGNAAFPVVLREHNKLQLNITTPQERDIPWGEVAIEIRRSAYLDELALTSATDEGWSLNGLVKGTCDQPLELYVMDGGRQLHYQEIEATPGGTRFNLSLPAIPSNQVRVDLVNVASIWYSQVLQRT